MVLVTTSPPKSNLPTATSPIASRVDAIDTLAALCVLLPEKKSLLLAWPRHLGPQSLPCPHLGRSTIHAS